MQRNKNIVVGLMLLFTASVRADITALDGTFAGGVKQWPSSRTTPAFAALKNTNNDLFVLGYTDVSGNQADFHVRKVKTNGSDDDSFGNFGSYHFDIAHANNEINAGVLLANGDLLLAGNTLDTNTIPANKSATLIKLDGNGNPVYLFGNNGVLAGTLVGKVDVIRQMLPQSNGQLIALGYRIDYPNGPTMGGKLYVVAIRLNQDGSLDASFGEAGTITLATDNSQYASGENLALQIDVNDRILIAYSYYQGSDIAKLQRFTVNGKQDDSFTSQIASHDGRKLFARQILIDNMDQDAIYWLLDDESDSEQKARVMKLSRDGRRNSSFGSNGQTNPNTMPASNDNHFVLMPDGKLMIFGAADNALKISRIATNGVPDETFGTNGGLVSTGLPSMPRLAGIYLQNDGKLLIAGSYNAGTTNESFFSARLNGYKLDADPITIADKTNQLRNTDIYFGPYAINGADGGSVTIHNGELRLINSGSCDQTATYSSQPQRFSGGQSLCLRHTSSNEFSTRKSATVNVGTQAVSFASITEAIDLMPQAFTFAPVTNVNIGSSVISELVQIVGINAAAPISISNGEYQIGDGIWTATPGEVMHGQTVRVRHTASAGFSAATTTVLNVGGVTGDFVSTTEAIDLTPDLFAFATVSGISVSSVVMSDAVQINGINAAAPINITNGEYQIGEGVWTTAAGEIAPGQLVRVRHTANTSFSANTVTVLTVGDVKAEFVSTTEAEDNIPDGFGFPPQSEVVKSTVITSSAVTPIGFNSSAIVTISGGEYSIAGGAFTSATGSLQPGEHIVVRHMSSTTAESSTTTTLTIGGVAGNFVSKTKADPSDNGGGGGALHWLLLAFVPLAFRRR